MKIYFVRHGETIWNKKRKYQGQVNTPLSEDGLRQARLTAEGMKEIPFDCIFSSPLQRAYVTADTIRGDRDIPIIQDERLKEISFGIYEGRFIDKMEAPGRNRALRFRNDPVRYRAPKYGENFTDVIKRADAFLKEQVFPLEGKMEHVLVAAHGCSLRSCILLLTGRELRDFWETPFGKNCSTALFEYENGQAKMIYENKIYY